MRSGFPKRGINTMVARIALCKNTEIVRARRRMLRSRLRCAGSPSTKQLCSKPGFSETLCGSTDITHLHKFSASRNRKFCGAGFRCASHQRPAPRSQGCEVARVLSALDTAARHKFPLPQTQLVKDSTNTGWERKSYASGSRVFADRYSSICRDDIESTVTGQRHGV